MKIDVGEPLADQVKQIGAGKPVELAVEVEATHRSVAARKSTPGRDRTCDTRFRKAVLYPLSYGGGNGSCLARTAR